MSDSAYKSAYDGKNKVFIEGPAPGGQCSYHGGFLYPGSRFATKAEGEKTAMMMNMAFKEGYKKAQADIRKALDITQ